ncbi:MAG: GNAT family N-acetyltransferase [Acidimicrobiales bacterium]|nr:MAG: GNAT family N-acetyltransferase [Acidimicrobiales bacterium]
MASLEKLRPGRLPPMPIKLESADSPSSALLLRSTYTHIATSQGWAIAKWTDEQWDEWFNHPERRRWILRAGVEPAGMVELEPQPGRQVEIVVFGLVPEFVGKGFAGHALTLATRLAWSVEHGKAERGEATQRVWLHTSSRDHPHAMSNYLRRGFRPFRTERKHKEVPT